jgi:sorting nexin-1/2
MKLFIENASSENPAPPRTAASAGKVRGGRTPKRFVPQATKIESVDDPMGPLGPLGDNFGASNQNDEPLLSPPAQPQSSKQVSSSNASLKTLMGSVNLDDDEPLPSSSKARVPPPVQPQTPGSPQRQIQPSVSIVEAAKPSFHITVGDPHKVGDLATVHTEYLVSTKVNSP